MSHQNSVPTDATTEQLYGIDRAILVDTPLCTQREYARRTGLSYSSVKNRVDRGELPVHRPKGSTSALINMMALAKEVLESEEVRV